MNMKKAYTAAVNETVWEGRLPNGLRIFVSAKPGFARSYAVFATRYGGADRRFRLRGEWLDTPAGIAHFLEHKMFDMPDGTSALTTLSEAGASPNAYTGSDITAYHFTCTKGFTENLRTLLTYVSTPYYTAESVAKEQGIIGQEIRMTEDNPGYVVFKELLKALYAHHPVRESVAGTVESIAEITPEVLYHCHEVFYNPSNMVLCCGGDVDPEEIYALAESILPKEPGEVPQRDYGAPETLTPVKNYTECAMEVSAPQFLMGVKLEPAEEGRERLRRAILAELALDYLAGSSSPYYTSLYSRGVLTADFGAELYECADARCLILGGESRDCETVRAELLAEVDKIRTGGLEPRRFGRCKRAYFGAALSALDSVEAVTGMLLDAAMGGWNAMDLFSLYEEITPEETAAFLTENITAERLALSVIQPC